MPSYAAPSKGNHRWLQPITRTTTERTWNTKPIKRVRDTPSLTAIVRIPNVRSAAKSDAVVGAYNAPRKRAIVPMNHQGAGSLGRNRGPPPRGQRQPQPAHWRD